MEFDHRRTDRLVIRRLGSGDASSFAAYRSDPTVARYQGWDTPVTESQARAFADGLSAANPDTSGEWFQFAIAEAATGVHVGDVAAGVDANDPRLVAVGITLASRAQRQGDMVQRRLQDCWITCSSSVRSVGLSGTCTLLHFGPEASDSGTDPHAAPPHRVA